RQIEGDRERLRRRDRQRQVVEVGALEQLGHEERPRVDLADAVDGDQVRVVQPRHRPRLDEEAGARLRRHRPARELDGHRPLEQRVGGEPDLRGGAAPEEALEPELLHRLRRRPHLHPCRVARVIVVLMGWPDLATPGWKETCDTLHLWSQIVGKLRLALAPMQNHWWHVPLYVTPTGLSTSVIQEGGRAFD